MPHQRRRRFQIHAQSGAHHQLAYARRARRTHGFTRVCRLYGATQLRLYDRQAHYLWRYTPAGHSADGNRTVGNDRRRRADQYSAASRADAGCALCRRRHQYPLFGTKAGAAALGHTAACYTNRGMAPVLLMEETMRELVLICLEAQAEALSDALIEAGVLSVSVEDADGDTDAEQPLFGEPGLEPDVQAWQNNRVVALLPDGLDPEQVLEQLRESGAGDFRGGDWMLREVPDADWVRLTQAQFKPIQVGARIGIVPSWHRDHPDVPAAQDGSAPAGLVHIELDPGLAFGTGTTPTPHL